MKIFPLSSSIIYVTTVSQKSALEMWDFPRNFLMNFRPFL